MHVYMYVDIHIYSLTDVLLLPAIYAGLLFFPPVNPSSF